MLHQLLYRLRAFFRRSSMEHDLEDELRVHLDHEVERLLRSGLDREQAARQARARFGGLEPVKDACRDERGLSWLRDAGRDVRGGLRLFHRSPGFASLATLTLALGIGLNTAMFTVIDSVLLQPLSFPGAERLVLPRVWLREWATGNAGGLMEQHYLDLQDQDHLLDGLAAIDRRTAYLTGVDEPAIIGIAAVTPRFFSVLGVRPLLGRTFNLGDDDPARDGVVVLSEDLWRRHFPGRADSAGARVTIDGVSRVVVGVVGGTLDQPFGSDAWIPTVIRVDPKKATLHTVVGRLKPSASLEQLRAQLETIAAPSLREQGEDPSEWVASVVPVREYVAGDVRVPLMILSGAVGFVLLIACGNVASLFLARTVDRSRELAVRAALGASRGRLVRQLLTESLMVSMAGGAAGLLVVVLAIPAQVSLAGDSFLALTHAIDVDWTVLAFTSGVSVLCGLLFGLAPVLATRGASLKIIAPGRAVTLPHDRLHATLVVVEIGLAVVLLTGAGLMIRSLAHLRAVEPGFATAEVSTVTVDLPAFDDDSADRMIRFHEAVVAGLARIPSVNATAAVNWLPLAGNLLWGDFTLEGGRELPPNYSADKMIVNPGYFGVMGIRLREGREFDGRDDVRAPGVAIVSAAVASTIWPGESALGKRISMRDNPAASDWLSIVGVVDDVRQRGPRAPVDHAIYQPLAQARTPEVLRHMSFVMRTDADPAALSGAVRSVFRDLDRDVPAPGVTTMDELAAWVTAAPRQHARLLGAFAALALLLTVVGIHGVLAYAVSRRTREFGIRLALGADRRQLILAVIRRSVVLSVIGICVGSVGAIALTGALRAFLFEVTPTDPATFAGVILLVVASAVLAGLIPARRAAHVDPCTSLRAE